MTIADTATEISGVPTAKVFGTIAKLRKNTDLAAFGLSARNTCHGGRGHGCPSAVNVEFDVDADASPPAIDAQTTDNRLGPSSPMQWRSERPSSPFAGPVSLPWHLRWATDLLDRQHRRAANQELIVAAVWQQVRQIRGSTLGSRDGVVDLAPVERRVAPRRSDTRQGGG